ncbi:glycerol-3-phosphate 1-O-acyltransferase PlsB [Aliidiomarina maris]|uniref:Glycerol-3-phosphate acyltransferase n=1 Tax=Aliidiomarina maris TaxID=531312 RepID=A0A327X3D7_9GAMM|nr:glycerol-3-phosphate 1-O-acyltransferase PlsB [Aliidiomarina maris]RAJ99152.1 glycerol-3-phosphate acyltransferase [Aliidiomarina maris]RUO27698.1 glycerol-3-phosphate 1-O-acyltransferase [Aliidiomarina maris]
MSFKRYLYAICKWPVRWLTKAETILDPHDSVASDANHIVYVMKSPSLSDLVVLQRAAKQHQLPDPLSPLTIEGQTFDRVLFVEDPKRKLDYAAEQPFGQLLALHQQHPKHNVLMFPAALFWGRNAGREEPTGVVSADIEVRSLWKRFMVLLFAGRNIMLRISRPVSLRLMADKYGNDANLGHKLSRVARTHFSRLRHAVAGPKLWSRDEMIRSLLRTPVLRQAIEDEARSKKITTEQAHQRAQDYLEEIAADYREGLVRIGDRVMTWLWNRLYNGIDVRHASVVRELAHDGHEIIYVPCHRSHMDYLLLSYVIYKQGLVPPHIAAGVNLNFWPAGPIFRRGGAFFIRRSFRGNKLYSIVFREYMGRLFQKGYSVEYFMEGGRSRTGRLLAPKTGMLAMTVQGQLRGISRPISLVPVYIGYEHVMEVATYHKELRGKSKQKESVCQVFGILRKLRNFGHGYVTFGKPVRLDEYLDAEQPNWRESSTRGIEEPAKPSWLTPQVNKLADILMRNINDGAVVNSINLSGLALLCAENRSLTKEELIAQFDGYLALLKGVPYSPYAVVPDTTGATLWQQAVKMDKFEVTQDAVGELASLNSEQALTMTYYRNNVLHLFAVPALVANFALAKQRFVAADVSDFVTTLMPMLRSELYLSQDAGDVPVWVAAICEQLVSQGWLRQAEGGYSVPEHDTQGYFQLRLLANAINETLARYGIVMELLKSFDNLSRADLEQHSEALAMRLGSMHGIDAPEFFDKRLFSTLVQVLKQEDYLLVNQQGDYVSNATTLQLSDTIDSLLPSPVVQTIKQSVKRLKEAAA